MTNNQKVHVIGICGVGMSATAILFKKLGYEVTGSDEDAYDPVYSQVIKSGISVIKEYNPANIPEGVKIIIIGMGTKLSVEKNDEVKKAYELKNAGKLEIYSYPVALREIIFKGYQETVVVAGSFGKSTVTAMTAFVMKNLNLEPGYFVGAIFTDENLKHAELGQKPWLVLEGDEYPTAHNDDRSKFLIYDPRYLILNACAHDHFNKFPTIDSYLKPYQSLLEKMSFKSDSILFVNKEMPNTKNVESFFVGKKVYFGKNNDNDYYYQIDSIENGITNFQIMKGDKELMRSQTSLLGEHNLVNWTAVVSFLDTLGFDIEKISQIIPTFCGLRRRLERLTHTESIPIYESFGSSFDKTVADLKAVKDGYPNLKIKVIFEPHTFSLRDRLSSNWYSTMFLDCEQVYISIPPESHGKIIENQLEMSEIVELISKSGIKSSLMKQESDFKSILESLNKETDVLVIVSSGDTNQKKMIVKDLFA